MFHNFDKNVIIFVNHRTFYGITDRIIITTVSIILNIIDIHVGLGGRVYDNYKTL